MTLTLFDNHFVPKRNVIHERAKFYSRSQSANESIEQYVRALHELAEHTDFQDRDESIRDRLVLGINNRELSQKLQLEKDLTLQSAVELARHFELVKAQVEAQRAVDQSVESVSRKQSRGGGRSQGARPKPQTKDSKNCGYCGYKLDGREHKCPAKGKKCNGCEKNWSFYLCV